MSQNQIQYQNQRAVRTCSCCGQTGHTITNCTSPQVLRFKEDAAAAAITASSIAVLTLRRPFTNTSLPILKAVAANIRIESSVSNLTVDYLTNLLACFYWHKDNPAGLRVNTRDELLLLFQAFRQVATNTTTNAIREQDEARIRQQRLEAQQRQLAAAAAEADRNLQLFLRQQQRYASEHVLIEDQRRRTRQAFIQAGLPVPPSVAQPFTPAPAPAAAPMLCLCCNSAEHNINNCDNYRGIPSMIKILALVCDRTEFRSRLQQHPNLYTHLAFAIQSKIVPVECRDCVVAMNKITDYYYQHGKYLQIRTDLQEYNIECAYQQLTGQALETNVIHDPRVGFYQSLIETSIEINFNNTNDQDFITKCIRISDTITVNVNRPRPIDITLGVKAASLLLTDEAKASADDDDSDEEEQSSCAVCLGAWDVKYPSITFGCNHDMCSRCVNTFFKTPNRPSCHLCRQPICHISVPSEALNSELFHGISVRILRQRQSSIVDLTI
jgi:hypothetical protein